MPNQLINENSPYLLQHANNPVDWYPWGAEALQKARQQDRPIFLSIGYAACHWCHVMAHESFEDEETARILNEHFISIKVDREERPDLDGIYMSAVVALTGQGGWPMSVFLTPDGHPFYGGTYFPPRPRHGLPSFNDVLLAIQRVWNEDRPRLLDSSRQISEHIAGGSDFQTAQVSQPDPKYLDEAALRLAQAYDWQYGGWGQAPKFPQPMAIDFLINRASRGDSFAGQVAVHALDAMSLGGMFDVVGGGFSRYSTDNNWLIPHFEKMLYDNAQLARVYLHAFLLTGNERYRQVCEQTLNFIQQELMEARINGAHPHAGIYSSLDADSEGVEGKYYIWALEDIHQTLVNQEDIRFFQAAFGVTGPGNFEGHTILQRARDDQELAEQFSMPIEEVPARLRSLLNMLLAARRLRIPPNRDDKVLTAWNGLALIAFAEASRYLSRQDYLDLARDNANFLLNELFVDGRLLRSWRAGKAQHNGYLEDYASLILGLLALYQADPDQKWFRVARRLADDMLIVFSDPAGGFFDTAVDQPHLIFRPKDIQDNATPSGNALASLALSMLSIYTGEQKYHDSASQILAMVQQPAARYPTAFGQWLIALDFFLQPTQEVAIIGDLHDPRTQALIQAVWERYRPYTLLAAANFPPEQGAPELLLDRTALAGLPTAYVCRHFTCQRPVTSPSDLLSQLNQ
jgi:hypothetical protein